MSRISNTLDDLKKRDRKALVTFVTAGDPNLRFTESLVPELVHAGADLIEIGVPFSDPVADGVAIQSSSQRALRSGITLHQILRLVRRLRPRISAPIILMGYYNPILRYGLRSLAMDASKASVDGIIIVDLPPEEAVPARAEFRKHGIDLIFLLTPASPKERIALVNRMASGFVYFVSYTGVTGARTTDRRSIAPHLARIRRATRRPVLIGFGIQSPSQARAMAAISDGVVVGSALIRSIERAGSPAQKIRRAAEFVRALRKGIDS